MRNRWFHPPLLHTESGPAKRTSWLELLFDLVFVAAVLQLGSGLPHFLVAGDRVEGLARYMLHFAPMWTAWAGFTFYANRFDVDDFTHRLLVFAQVIGIALMAIGVSSSMSVDMPRSWLFVVGASLAHLAVGLHQLRTWRHTRVAREYSRYWGGVFGVAGLAWAASLAVSPPGNHLVWLVGILAVLAAPLAPESRRLAELHPVDQTHLSERFGVVMVLLLGAGFVMVMPELGRQWAYEPDVSALGPAGFALSITLSLWWIYFDDIAGSKLRPGILRWVRWMYAHVVMAMGLALVSVAMRQLIEVSGMAPGDPARAMVEPTANLLFAGSLALVFLSVAVVDEVSERRQAELDDRWRVILRTLSALLLLAFGAANERMGSSLFLTLVSAVCLVQVAIDMVVAPYEESEHDELGAVGLAEEARRRAEPGETTPARERQQRRDISEAVRIGTPTEFRQDLYFFLIQGGWGRLIGAMGVGYVVLNIGFATLFMLDEQAITQEGFSFSDAFFFSVQTMSTIGYGTLSPGSLYADVLVTMEAAVGLLGVALATGLIFAKVSRPMSRVLFSETVVLTTWHGERMLSFRCGNARGNEVVEASMTVSVLMDELSAEGQHLRRILDLPMVRSRSPIFSLSWSLMHVIDEHSPLKDVNWDQPQEHLLSIVCSLMGHDATYGQTIHARHLYYPEDIEVGRSFVDIISTLPDGRLVVDYRDFHATQPDESE